MAEQFVGEELLREAAAVHGNEGAAGTPAVGMDGARKELFSRASLADDEHVGINKRHLTGGIERFLHRPVAGDDPSLAREVLGVFLQTSDPSFEVDAADGLLDRLPHLVELEGLRDIGECPVLHRLDGGLKRRVARDHDDLGVGVAFAAFFQYLHAVHLLHAHVRQHHVELLLIKIADGIGPALGAHDLVAILFHDVFEVLKRHPFIIDDQKSCRNLHYRSLVLRY